LLQVPKHVCLLFFNQINFFMLYLGLFKIQISVFINFSSIWFCVFVSSIIHTNLRSYPQNHNHSFILFVFSILIDFLVYIYNWIALWKPLNLISWVSVLKEVKGSRLWGKRCGELIRVKSLDFVWNTSGWGYVLCY
jgi:hypothetical protein